MRKIHQTGGGPPPTPPKMDELAKAVQEINPDYYPQPHEILDSSAVSLFLDHEEDSPVILGSTDSGKDICLIYCTCTTFCKS